MRRNRYGEQAFFAAIISLFFVTAIFTALTGKCHAADNSMNMQEVTAQFAPAELAVINQAAERNNCHGDLRMILYAIRLSENGAPGREFGVLHPRAIDTNLNTQAGWAAATIVKNHQRWIDEGSPGNFISYLGARYAPVHAQNDPRDTNKVWVHNVTNWFDRFKMNVSAGT